MLIQDLSYIDNADCANEVKGSRSSESPRQTGGNLGAATARSVALGANTFSASRAKVDVWQGVGSSSSSYSVALSISD